MSSNGRPWFPWFPKDFVVDEKVQCLTPLAELIYRRALDVMWQSSTICLPNDTAMLYQCLGKGMEKADFESAWGEIQREGWELFAYEEGGKTIYSRRLRKEFEKSQDIINQRKTAGSKGGQASAQAKAQAKSNTDTYTYTDTNNKKNICKFLLKDGTEYIIPVDYFSELKRLYPLLDLEKHFRDMEVWCLSNESKRKTRRGAKKFIANWLRDKPNDFDDKVEWVVCD